MISSTKLIRAGSGEKLCMSFNACHIESYTITPCGYQSYFVNEINFKSISPILFYYYCIIIVIDIVPEVLPVTVVYLNRISTTPCDHIVF